MSNETRRIVAWGGVDETCSYCSQAAKHRWRDGHGRVVLAACRAHAVEARESLSRPSVDHERLNGMRFTDAQLRRVESERPIDGIPVPVQSRFELAAYRMPNGSRFVTLVDGKQATWEAYGAEGRAKTMAQIEARKARDRARVGMTPEPEPRTVLSLALFGY